MKVKLKDLTEEQYIKWDCYKYYDNCNKCIFKNITCNNDKNDCWIYHKESYSEEFLNQEIDINNKILTEEEKEYLENFLKPFKDRVKFIVKISTLCYGVPCYAIKIILNGRTDLPKEFEIVCLPCFLKNEMMYVNMEENKSYNSKDLGLWGE